MPAGSFEKTNIGWQIKQFRQQVAEWLELQFSNLDPKLPDWSWPDWSNWPLAILLGEAVFWLAIALLVTWLGWQVWRISRPYIYSAIVKYKLGRSAVDTVAPSEPSVAVWLERAREQERQGNYAEACRCLYQGMLQQLNDRGIAPHQASRTDGEYRQLLSGLQLGDRGYQTLLAVHEELCFGNVVISAATFDRVRQAYQNLFSR